GKGGGRCAKRWFDHRAPASSSHRDKPGGSPPTTLESASRVRKVRAIDVAPKTLSVEPVVPLLAAPCFADNGETRTLLPLGLLPDYRVFLWLRPFFPRGTRRVSQCWTCRVHADRVAGVVCHHRHPHRPAPTRRAKGARGRRPRPVQQQSQADWPGRPQLPRQL